MSKVADSAVYGRRSYVSEFDFVFHRFQVYITFPCPVVKPQKSMVLFSAAIPRTHVVCAALLPPAQRFSSGIIISLPNFSQLLPICRVFGDKAECSNLVAQLIGALPVLIRSRCFTIGDQLLDDAWNR